MNILKYIGAPFAAMIILYVVLFMAFDAYDFERTGNCDECLVLKVWFQWVEEQRNE